MCISDTLYHKGNSYQDHTSSSFIWISITVRAYWDSLFPSCHTLGNLPLSAPGFTCQRRSIFGKYLEETQNKRANVQLRHVCWRYRRIWNNSGFQYSTVDISILFFVSNYLNVLKRQLFLFKTDVSLLVFFFNFLNFSQ